MFEYNLYLIYILSLLTNFIYVNHYIIIDTVDIVDDEGYFEFSPKAEFRSVLQGTLG